MQVFHLTRERTLLHKETKLMVYSGSCHNKGPVGASIVAQPIKVNV